MIDEYLALLRNNSRTLVTLPQNRKAIGNKWVFNVKENPDGNTNKFKTRLIAKGYHQITSFDFNATFSSVVKPTTIKIVLTIALLRGWKIQQLDINKEKVYMEQLVGFEDPKSTGLVCKLNKALYGLKQAPRAWFENLRFVLVDFGFVSSKVDNSLFLRHSAMHTTYVLVYVDDILITKSSKHEVSSLVAKLNHKFAIKDLGELSYFLSIQVQHTIDGGLHLTQTKCICFAKPKYRMLESFLLLCLVVSLLLNHIKN